MLSKLNLATKLRRLLTFFRGGNIGLNPTIVSVAFASVGCLTIAWMANGDVLRRRENHPRRRTT